MELKSENVSIKQELATLKTNVSALESGDTKMPVPTTEQLPQLLQELSEREKYLFNAMVRGFLESTTTSPVDRVADDLKLLSDTT